LTQKDGTKKPLIAERLWFIGKDDQLLILLFHHFELLSELAIR
jgi:hypothetical protein